MTTEARVTEYLARPKPLLIDGRWVEGRGPAFEVHDPALYTQVWKGEVGLNRVNEQVYEYACHEGNHGLLGILEGGRAADRAGKDIREAGDRDEG